MAAYTTRAKVEGRVPPAFLVEALDDDADGSEDAGVFDQLVADASDEIDAYLEGRYALPLGSTPKLVSTAALFIVCEALYERRGYTADTDPKNPWSQRAANVRDKLAAVSKGEMPLELDIDKGGSQVTAVTEAAKTTPSSGKNLA